MGGLQDGALCAASTIAHFIASLLVTRSTSIMHEIEIAVREASDAVYQKYRGKGGATLSAVVVSSDGSAIGVNVGDSRIYASIKTQPEFKVARLTVDDTMKEAFGSEGNGLLQFIGVGGGIRPHIFDIDNQSLIALTTDGAHFVDQKIFSEIIDRSPDPKAIVERTIALSRWLGAPDNSSAAAVDLRALAKSYTDNLRDCVELWSGGRDGPIYFANVDASRRRVPASEPVEKQQIGLENISAGDVRQVKADKSPTKTRRRKKPVKSEDVGEQLTIDVEVTKDGGADADR